MPCQIPPRPPICTTPDGFKGAPSTEAKVSCRAEIMPANLSHAYSGGDDDEYRAVVGSMEPWQGVEDGDLCSLIDSADSSSSYDSDSDGSSSPFGSMLSSGYHSGGDSVTTEVLGFAPWSASEPPGRFVVDVDWDDGSSSADSPDTYIGDAPHTHTAGALPAGGLAPSTWAGSVFVPQLNCFRAPAVEDRPIGDLGWAAGWSVAPLVSLTPPPSPLVPPEPISAPPLHLMAGMPPGGQVTNSTTP